MSCGFQKISSERCQGVGFSLQKDFHKDTQNPVKHLK